MCHLLCLEDSVEILRPKGPRAREVIQFTYRFSHCGNRSLRPYVGQDSPMGKIPFGYRHGRRLQDDSY